MEWFQTKVVVPLARRYYSVYGVLTYVLFIGTSCGSKYVCIREREKERRKGVGGREGRTQGFTIAEE